MNTEPTRQFRVAPMGGVMKQTFTTNNRFTDRPTAYGGRSRV
jgi:hypothetical protein